MLCMCMCIYVYVCIYIEREIYITDFRGFDSGRILIIRGGSLRSIGSFPESLSQAILVGRCWAYAPLASRRRT